MDCLKYGGGVLEVTRRFLRSFFEALNPGLSKMGKEAEHGWS